VRRREVLLRSFASRLKAFALQPPHNLYFAASTSESFRIPAALHRAAMSLDYEKAEQQQQLPLLGGRTPLPKSELRWRPLATAALVAFALGATLAAVTRAASAAAPMLLWRGHTVAAAATPHPTLGHTVDCASPLFSKRTLKVVDEYPIARMVFDERRMAAAKGLTKFEASDVSGVPGEGNPFFVVLDNSFKVFRVGPTVSLREDNGNGLLSWPGDVGDDSQFECLAYNMTSASFVAVQEMISANDGSMSARMFDVTFVDDTVIVADECGCDYEFVKENKGFEGAIVMDGADGASYMLALCEGNHCNGGKKGRDTGNGRVVVLRRGVDGSGKCLFKTVGEVKLPKEVDFVDYSAITLDQNAAPGKDGEMTVAVASQENSAIWVGSIKPVRDGTKLFEFGSGTIYDFPPDGECRHVYCNVEGIHFATDRTIVAVSDAMKSKGKQDYRCWEKAQSVHLVSF
jgi:hypothetical protein